MGLEKIFEDGVEHGLFTDYHFASRGLVNMSFRQGKHISNGAHLFDVASLTKACNHLLFLKLFNESKLSPENFFRDFISVPGDNGRKLWHFLCYVVKDYNFGYEALRSGHNGRFRDTLLKTGFGYWGKRFQYDNISSAYLAFLLEELYEAGIEDIFQKFLLPNGNSSQDSFIFHPVSKHGVPANKVVPTCSDPKRRGFVHDPLSFAHKNENIAVAGLFTDADTLVDIFHEIVDRMIHDGFYDEMSSNQLEKIGVSSHRYALGFDIPFPLPKSLEGFRVEGPLIFAGWTGCRIFFCKVPRLTVCFLTNRVFCDDTSESRRVFSEFSWNVIRQALNEAA